VISNSYVKLPEGIVHFDPVGLWKSPHGHPMGSPHEA
jgi:hypothetical protein